MSNVRLRDVVEADIETFYEHQLDPEAAQMAAFPSRDHEAFTAHWKRILANDAGVVRTVLAGEEIAGNIVCWEQDGLTLIGYWIGRSFWGRGIATAALAQFVQVVKSRPLHAHVVSTNLGSIRVLEKCGFEPDPDNPRHVDDDGVEELLMRLER